MIYKMSAIAYANLKKSKTVKGRNLTEKEILNYVNKTAGILGGISKIVTD